MSKAYPLKLICERIAALSSYLSQDANPALDAQRHLDADSDEHLYWHAGYQAALIDAMQMLQAANYADHNMDIPSDYLSDVRGGRSCH